MINSPTTFMNMMNNVLGIFLDKFVLVFTKDILIYSKNEEQREEHLQINLKILSEHHLCEKLSKCDFYKREVQYLGHIISEEGVAVDPAKIQEITE